MDFACYLYRISSFINLELTIAYPNRHTDMIFILNKETWLRHLNNEADEASSEKEKGITFQP